MLYIVATPIGNLKDITFRALEVLKEVDIIACEDTRHTKILLDHYDIQKPLVSYFQHSKLSKINKIIELIESGKSVALVTDAGTPGIADPGGLLVDRLISESANWGNDKVEIVPIPGANAAVSALSISGFNTDEFVFYGFLPTKKGRQTKLKELANEKRVSVLYESPYRIKKLLNELLQFVGDREVVVCRELTKKFEETYRGKVSEIIDQVKEKGEFVIVIDKHEIITNNSLNNTKDKGHEKTTNNALSTTKPEGHKGDANNIVDLLYRDLSYEIQGIAKKIREELGSGQKESVYQKSFEEKLALKRISFEKEKDIKIISRDTGRVIGVIDQTL